MAIFLLKSRFLPQILSARLFAREIALALLLTVLVETEGRPERMRRCKLSALSLAHVRDVATIGSAKVSLVLMLLIV